MRHSVKADFSGLFPAGCTILVRPNYRHKKASSKAGYMVMMLVSCLGWVECRTSTKKLH